MITAHGLTFQYAHLPLFKDVNFSVGPGELLHIQGPNGVGKSTLLSLIAGHMEPTAGRITVTALANNDHDRRIHLEYVPAEGNGLFSRLDAMANLRFWSSLRGHQLTDDELAAALTAWGITNPFFHRRFPVGKFSTGMKRRLALARADLSRTPIWLLDEPVYGLDSRAITIFQNRLNAHLGTGGCALIVSHDIAAFGASRPVILDLSQFVPEARRT